MKDQLITRNNNGYSLFTKGSIIKATAPKNRYTRLVKVWAKGVYFLNISSNNYSDTFKFIIEKY